jgi:hypothetical protein
MSWHGTCHSNQARKAPEALFAVLYAGLVLWLLKQVLKH